MLTLLFTWRITISEISEVPVIIMEFSPPPRTIVFPVTVTLFKTTSLSATPSPITRSPVIFASFNVTGLLMITFPFFSLASDLDTTFGNFWFKNVFKLFFVSFVAAVFFPNTFLVLVSEIFARTDATYLLVAFLVGCNFWLLSGFTNPALTAIDIVL